MVKHLGHYGRFWNGQTAETDLRSWQWLRGGADKWPRMAARGVLLDIARLKGVDCLLEGYCITPDDLAGAAEAQNPPTVRGRCCGDRTGRMAICPELEGYVRSTPGICLTAGRVPLRRGGRDVHRHGRDQHGRRPAPRGRTFVPVHDYLFASTGTRVIEV